MNALGSLYATRGKGTGRDHLVYWRGGNFIRKRLTVPSRSNNANLIIVTGSQRLHINNTNPHTHAHTHTQRVTHARTQCGTWCGQHLFHCFAGFSFFGLIQFALQHVKKFCAANEKCAVKVQNAANMLRKLQIFFLLLHVCVCEWAFFLLVCLWLVVGAAAVVVSGVVKKYANAGARMMEWQCLPSGREIATSNCTEYPKGLGVDGGLCPISGSHLL